MSTILPQQKRYKDWKAPVSSKESMEPLAIVGGIGAKFGFDLINTVGLTGNTLSFNITSKNVTTPGVGGHENNRYIVDNLLNVIRPVGGIVTPDGVLTLVTAPLSFSENISGQPLFNGSWEFLIVAKHTFIEEEDLEASKLTIRAIPNMGTSLKALLGLGSDMSAWLNHTSLSGLEVNYDVVIGLISLNLSVPLTPVTSVLIPYNYKWPKTKPISDEEWEGVYNLLMGVNVVRPTVSPILISTNKPPLTFNNTIVAFLSSYIQLIQVGRQFTLNANIRIDHTGNYTGHSFSVHMPVSHLFTSEILNNLSLYGLTVEDVYKTLGETPYIATRGLLQVPAMLSYAFTPGMMGISGALGSDLGYTQSPTVHYIVLDFYLKDITPVVNLDNAQIVASATFIVTK